MISEKAIVQTNDIGINPTILEFSIIREGVKIGNNVIIHPNVIIESGVSIGDNVEIFPGTYVGKVPKGVGALARKPVYSESIEIGANCSIGPNAVIFYDVTIGEDTLIGDGASIREQCVIGSKCIISRYVTVNYETTIGDRTKVMDNSHITGKCIIENDVFIGPLVGSANDNAIGKEGFNEKVRGQHICEGAVIGLGALLLPNTRIGKNATVAAGALVSKDVPDGAVVMGIPAKIVKFK